MFLLSARLQRIAHFHSRVFLQICQWLLAQSMETYIQLFMSSGITGEDVLGLDGGGLKDLGIRNKEDREKIKKKIKEMKTHNEREKKEMTRKDKLLRKKK